MPEEKNYCNYSIPFYKNGKNKNAPKYAKKSFSELMLILI